MISWVLIGLIGLMVILFMCLLYEIGYVKGFEDAESIIDGKGERYEEKDC